MNSLSLLIKPASSLCNMRCRYCFYTDVSEHREKKCSGVMSSDTVDVLISKVFASSPDAVSFMFQGGEPLICSIGFFRDFVSKVKKSKPDKCVVSFALQTNGLLIDDDFAEFFAENGFLIGLSLDGDKDMNDMNRLDADGKSTFSRVMRAARLLGKHGAEYNILTVVTDRSVRNTARMYGFFKKSGFRYLQFIPCIDDFGSDAESLSPEKYGAFLKTLFDLWYRDYINGDYISIRQFDNYLSLLRGYPPENCAMCGECGRYFTVESNGDIYPCDFYCVDSEKLGNISDPSPFSLSDKQRDFIEKSHLAAESCSGCEYYFLCRGGCRRDREPSLIRNRFCRAYTDFFDYALDRLEKLL